MVTETNFILSGSNGVPRWSYLVLTSTNAALPLADWTIATTNVFDASGNFVLSNAQGANWPSQQFYLLELH